MKKFLTAVVFACLLFDAEGIIKVDLLRNITKIMKYKCFKGTGNRKVERRCDAIFWFIAAR